MKIAVVTDDGAAVAQHFGRARYYHVYTVEEGAIVSSELRDRTGTLHHGHGHDHHHDHDHHHGHGHDHAHGTQPGAADRHAGMVAQINDVTILLAGGMGYGARRALSDAGIEVVATDIRGTEDAVRAFLDGTLPHREERVH